MKICGLKLTHDGTVALIDNGKLIFSVEMEKLRNNARYTEINDTIIIEQILNAFNYGLQVILTCLQ